MSEQVAARADGAKALHQPVVLNATGLTKRFTEGRLDVTVLQGVDLTVRAGETLAIVGASGSGKSTLLHLLGGLDAPSAGSVTLAGQNLASLSAAQQGALRNQYLGFVYQFHHLLPEFSALDNVAMPLWIRRLPRAEAAKQAEAMLARVGLTPWKNNMAGNMSGGQQQRVALARALAKNPALLLADEPTGNLDTKSADAVFALLRRINQEQGTTVLLVTHNPELGKRCDKTIQVVDGLIQA